jgi:hypothetical protein
MAVGVSAGLAALCGASAVSGYLSGKRCNEVKDLNRRCISGDPAACQALKAGWIPVRRTSSRDAYLDEPPPVLQPATLLAQVSVAGMLGQSSPTAAPRAPLCSSPEYWAAIAAALER